MCSTKKGLNLVSSSSKPKNSTLNQGQIQGVDWGDRSP